MSTLPTLTVIVIAHNCADDLERCLRSVRDWANEMIVVDSLSTDDTVMRARSLGAQVVSQEWLGYAKQKNVALDLAKSEWILWLDSDETLQGDSLQDLRSCLSASIDADGWTLPRQTSFLGRWLHCLREDRVLRLFRNKNNHRFEDTPLHETMVVEGSVGALSGYVIKHVPYRSLSHYMKKFCHYGDLYVQKNPNKKVSFARLLVVGPARFCKLYFLKKGFLDGYQGLIFSGLSAAHDFYKYARVWEFQQQGDH